ncbi:MAG: hypothetical protein ACP5P1_08785 [Acidimicrobiales bacterium]
MTPKPSKTARLRGCLPTRRFAAFALISAAYAWYATGLRPFTNSAYEAVFAAPAILLAFGLLSPAGRRTPRDSPTLRAVAPWVTLAVLAGCLEAIGLALGGRSPVVPTLSTVVDHALGWHASRFVLFIGWLKLGTGPLSGPWRNPLRRPSGSGPSSPGPQQTGRSL